MSKLIYTLISVISHFVATKVHVILSYIVLTWMHDKKRISVACDIMKQHKVNITIMTM